MIHHHMCSITLLTNLEPDTVFNNSYIQSYLIFQSTVSIYKIPIIFPTLRGKNSYDSQATSSFSFYCIYTIFLYGLIIFIPEVKQAEVLLRAAGDGKRQSSTYLLRLLIWTLMSDIWLNFIFIYCLHHIIRTWSFFHWHDSYKHWKSQSHGSNSGQYSSFHVHLPKGRGLFLQDIWTWGSTAKDISSAWHKSQTSSPKSSTVADGEPRLKM